MIVNASLCVANETFGWIVTQILYAETARQQTPNAAPPKTEQAHV